MRYKRFRVQCTIRVTAIALGCLVAATLFHPLGQTLWGCVAAFFVVWQTLALFRYVERVNRDLAHFFESVKYQDYSRNFGDEGAGKSFAGLRKAMEAVMADMRRLRAEKEEHAHYLQTVVQHVGIGLLVFQPDGEVESANAAAKRLLNVSVLKNLAALSEKKAELVETLIRLAPQEKGFYRDEEENLYLVLYATEFRMRGKHFKLVSLQNIQRELEEKEMEAWHKLIRIITHEIMNSITPITSLASTVSGLIGETCLGPTASEKEAEAGRDIQEALHTIVRRSQGLIQFVESFRKLTLVSKPKFQILLVSDLFRRLENLMRPAAAAQGVALTLDADPTSLEISADSDQVEQVLLNLLRNALQALEGRAGGTIRVEARLGHRDRVEIRVSDNGPGIAPENLDRVFIPFFSTKEGGSGIGLSLSREIMRRHHGGLRVHSEPNARTTFTLSF